MKKNKIIIILIAFLSVIFITFLLVIGGSISYLKLKNKKPEIPSNIEENVSMLVYEDTEYYIMNDDYKGEYDIQDKMLPTKLGDTEEFPDINKILSYDEMSEYCKRWNLTQKYNDESKNYIVFSYTARGAVDVDARLADVETEENYVNLYIWDYRRGVTADMSFYTIIIPTENELGLDVRFTSVYTEEEFKEIQKNIRFDRKPEITVDKPVIYLYPENEMSVEVSLGKPELITHSYPKYNKQWKVIAYPDGTLKDINTERDLYSLYYESESCYDFKVENEGFVVKGSEAALFLEDKLEILGLNQKEAEEFIIYWLPILESNEYNYIRFATNDEINENMPLTINPAPDTTIRILMIFKGLDEPINVKEQSLEHIERSGFSVIEWGGVKLQ